MQTKNPFGMISLSLLLVALGAVLVLPWVGTSSTATLDSSLNMLDDLRSVFETFGMSSIAEEIDKPIDKLKSFQNEDFSLTESRELAESFVNDVIEPILSFNEKYLNSFAATLAIDAMGLGETLDDLESSLKSLETAVEMYHTFLTVMLFVLPLTLLISALSLIKSFKFGALLPPIACIIAVIGNFFFLNGFNTSFDMEYFSIGIAPLVAFVLSLIALAVFLVGEQKKIPVEKPSEPKRQAPPEIKPVHPNPPPMANKPNIPNFTPPPTHKQEAKMEDFEETQVDFMTPPGQSPQILPKEPLHKPTVTSPSPMGATTLPGMIKDAEMTKPPLVVPPPVLPLMETPIPPMVERPVQPPQPVVPLATPLPVVDPNLIPPQHPVEQCPQCQALWQEGNLFCAQCGSPKANSAPSFCTGCGKPLNPDQNFCTGCGLAK